MAIVGGFECTTINLDLYKIAEDLDASCFIGRFPVDNNVRIKPRS